jgi:hypothetical protein
MKSAGPSRGRPSWFVAGGGSHHPADKAGSALTGRTAPLVFAPEQEQAMAPKERRLGVATALKREQTNRQLQRTLRHATPMAEALHVATPCRRSCWIAARSPRGEQGRPRRKPMRPAESGQRRRAASRGLGRARVTTVGERKSRSVMLAAPSTSALLTGKSAMRDKHASPQFDMPPSGMPRTVSLAALAPPPLRSGTARHPRLTDLVNET